MCLDVNFSFWVFASSNAWQGGFFTTGPAGSPIFSFDQQEVPFSPLNVSGAPALGLLQWLFHLPEPSSPDAPMINHCRGSGGMGNYLFLRLSPCRDGPQRCFLLHSAPGLDVSSSSSAGSGLPPVTEGHLSAELCSIVISTSAVAWMLVFPLNGCAGTLTPNMMELGGGTFGRWLGSDKFLRVGSLPMMGLVSL